MLIDDAPKFHQARLQWRLLLLGKGSASELFSPELAESGALFLS